MALSDVLARAQLRLGLKPNQRALGRGVPRTFEFKRIAALPRREWLNDETLDELNRVMGAVYGRKESRMPLWRTQCAALRDLAEQGGLLAPIPVGGGKAFVSVLAPVIYGAVSLVRSPVLFVPPRLRQQTLGQVIPLLSKHWNLHPDLLVLSSSFLSQAKNADFLNERKPSMIIIDEAHEWKNKQAARVRRLGRYLKAHPETVVVILSGTMTRKSIKDYAHLSEWALGEGSPLPRGWREIETWSRALDADVEEYDRLGPGALADFCVGEENVREGFRRRLVQTPGVVSGPEKDIGVSLYLSARQVKVPPKIHQAIEKLKATWETPGGDLIAEAAQLWAAARQLACGFYYRWNPAPPRDWLNARRAWKQYVRKVLRYNKRGLDSELQVWNDAAEKKRIEWLVWSGIKDTFKPNVEAVWLSDFLLLDVAAWLDDHPAGVAWTEHTAFGRRFEEFYYGAGTELPKEVGPIVCSIKAHGVGKNMQGWQDNLVVSCPSSGKTMQQLLGRTHRHGQEADTVSAEFYFHTQVLRDAWKTSTEDAHYLQDTTGNRQKILYADRDFDFS